MGYRMTEEKYLPAQSRFIDILSRSTDRRNQIDSRTAQSNVDSIRQAGQASGTGMASLGQGIGQGIKNYKDRKDRDLKNKLAEEQNARAQEALRMEKTAHEYEYGKQVPEGYQGPAEEGAAHMRDRLANEARQQQINMQKGQLGLQRDQFGFQEQQYADAKAKEAKTAKMIRAKKDLTAALRSGDPIYMREVVNNLGAEFDEQTLTTLQNDALGSFNQSKNMENIALQQSEGYREMQPVLQDAQRKSQALARLENISADYDKIGNIALGSAQTDQEDALEREFITLMDAIEKPEYAKGLKSGWSGMTDKIGYMKKTIKMAMDDVKRDLQAKMNVMGPEAKALAQKRGVYNIVQNMQPKEIQLINQMEDPPLTVDPFMKPDGEGVQGGNIQRVGMGNGRRTPSLR